MYAGIGLVFALLIALYSVYYQIRVAALVLPCSSSAASPSLVAVTVIADVYAHDGPAGATDQRLRCALPGGGWR